MTESNLQAQWVQLEFVASVAKNPCCTLFNIMYPKCYFQSQIKSQYKKAETSLDRKPATLLKKNFFNMYLPRTDVLGNC